MMKTKYLIPMLLLLSAGAAAQTSKQEIYKDPNRSGGYYYPYPGPVQKALTPAPAGYEPFYISHHGRHGSRFMTDNAYYEIAIQKLDTAAQLGILTPKGAQVLETLRKGYADAWKRDGELSALGGRQHQEIARRMYERFPELLSQPMQVDARSSVIGRCLVSMFYFCEQLQGMNPALDIRMAASQRDMRFVIGNSKVKIEESPAQEEMEERVSAMLEKAANPDRLMKTLFTDVPRAKTFVDGYEFIEALFNIASDLPNIPESGLSLTDLFTKEEKYGIWKGSNAGLMLALGLIPGSTPAYEMQREARDSIVSMADQVIRSGKPALTLRFGHDSSLVPLAYLMGLKEATGGTSDFDKLNKSLSMDKLVPMAANIQLVFYRKEGSDDVLVKFLLNENETSIPVKTDVAPYYHWKDVKDYWASYPIK